MACSAVARPPRILFCTGPHRADADAGDTLATVQALEDVAKTMDMKAKQLETINRNNRSKLDDLNTESNRVTAPLVP